MSQDQNPLVSWWRDLPPDPTLSRSAAAQTRTLAERRDGRGTIDHRYARRLRVHIPIVLRFCHGLRAYGIACDLSRDGIFIETAARPDLNCCLDLLVPAPLPTDPGPLLLPALLVHRTDLGLGLMFRHLQDRDAVGLALLLGEAQSSRRWPNDTGPAN